MGVSYYSYITRTSIMGDGSHIYNLQYHITTFSKL